MGRISGSCMIALMLSVAIVAPATGLAAKRDVVRLAWWGDGTFQKEFMEDVINPFEAKYPDIDVKLEATPWADYWTKLDISIAAGTAPDVMMIWSAEMPKYARSNSLMDLTPLASTDKALDLPDFQRNLVRASTYKGKLVMLPNEAASLGLFYNADLASQSGLVISPTDPMTREQWVEAARKLTKDKNGDGKPEIWGTCVPWADMQATVHYFRQDGGEMFDEDKDICLLDQPRAIDTVQFFHDMVNKFKVATTGGDFSLGKIGMYQDGAWSLLNYRKVIKFDWNVAPIPRAKQRVTTTWGTGFAISRTTKLRQESWDLLKFIMSKKAMERSAKSGRIVPPRKSVMGAFVDPSLKPKNIAVLVDELEYAEPTPMLHTWQTVSQAIQKVWYGPLFQGKSSVETELKKLTKQINVIMRKE